MAKFDALTSLPSLKRALALSLAMSLWALPSRAADPPTDALPFAKSHMITGNYVVAGTDFVPQPGGNGFMTRPISVSGVPANAEILSAFLYWETISTARAQVDGVKFRGQPVTVVKGSSKVLEADTSACWESGGATPRPTLTMYRADVLRFLPLQMDANGKFTGRRLVNDADLAADQKLTVTLPQSASSTSRAPQSAGASLLVIYRDPSEPLTSVVLYDGVFVQPPGRSMDQRIRGFLQSSSANRAAKLTHIVSGGPQDRIERLWFNGSQVATDPFGAAADSSIDRAWSSPTFNVSALMPGQNAGGAYGEEVTTKVDYRQSVPHACLAWAAVVFSTAVQDTDGDGLVDALESRSGLRTPDDHALPDLHAMGA